MNQVLTFVGISGSLRKASRNAGLLRCAAKQVPAGVTFEQASLLDIPLFNADVESQGKPAVVAQFVRQIATADALVIACPEYNYSMAPALKNAIDWLSREPQNCVLNGKPVAIMGAGGGMGTARAQYHLRQVCVYVNLRPLNKPEVFSNAFSDSFDDNGDVCDDNLVKLIATQMETLVACVKGRM